MSRTCRHILEAAQPNPLCNRPGATSAPGLLARNLPHLPQRAAARPPTTTTTNLTEHY